jgi:hypothetical protein
MATIGDISRTIPSFSFIQASKRCFEQMNFSENLVRWYSFAFNVPFFCSKVIRNDKVNRIDHQNDGDK